MEEYQVFSEKQILELNKGLDPRFISNRKGGGNTTLKYIEGHDAIDQANRLFGFGNWSYRPLSCEQKVLLDPMTGEAVGVAYKAQVELIVRGCVAPIVEVGSQPVASWNITDVVLSRRKKEEKAKPIEDWEKMNAGRTIVEAHEMAEKGAVTDALKRALRTFGDQFGNGLYGDGRVMLEVTEQQKNSIHKASLALGREITIPKTFEEAKDLIAQLNAEYKEAKAKGTLPSQEKAS